MPYLNLWEEEKEPAEPDWEEYDEYVRQKEISEREVVICLLLIKGVQLTLMVCLLCCY